MIEIMLAKIEHIPMLQDIELEAASKSSYDDLPEHLRAETISINILKKAQRKGLLLVAIENGDTPVGFAVMEQIDSYLHLLEIDVLPRVQRQGIGSLLLDKVIEIAIQQGQQWVSLTTFSHLPWNAPWYEKKGFHKIKTENLPGFLVDVLFDEKERGLNPNNRVAMRIELKQ